mmetsp:Transcript_91078/g.273525  ORF Transcript_91078/g.273525 Transcript_91078/m.273525 type:complete len:283 (-) Transcript_91078:37-885(-)
MARAGRHRRGAEPPDAEGGRLVGRRAVHTARQHLRERPKERQPHVAAHRMARAHHAELVDGVPARTREAARVGLPASARVVRVIHPQPARRQQLLEREARAGAIALLALHLRRHELLNRLGVEVHRQQPEQHDARRPRRQRRAEHRAPSHVDAEVRRSQVLIRHRREHLLVDHRPRARREQRRLQLNKLGGGGYARDVRVAVEEPRVARALRPVALLGPSHVRLCRRVRADCRLRARRVDGKHRRDDRAERQHRRVDGNVGIEKPNDARFARQLWGEDALPK